ncbi:endoplasmic reticulum metallopeptidase 1 isoform X2 [Orussus abietinus]|uniref:endoplasmic reticulum metallopeptidase 1 isoform X2 n=1 Tax=Orussus abietinus TaxID=222816 RepID=UPI000625752E|nr:endoplasmic reticulum metallopeptidase 1 isoform X2 [Orussus abietinus]
MKDGIRFRQRATRRSTEDLLCNGDGSSKKRRTILNGTYYLFFIITFYVGVSLTVIVMEKNLPEPQLLDSEVPGRFNAERARNHIVNLTSIGPRVCGSYENEVLAVKFLKAAIKDIVKGASENHKIAVEVTKHSGSFPLTFLDGLTSVYRNIQNVVVKLGPHNPSRYSLLLNCHFDTFPESPGGSDDAAGCAVMLEVLRVLAHSPKYLRHNVIFLFNGAEENLLQASHGFITQHHWAKEVKAFINLEACGAGGRELMFQAGPDDSWIVEVYAKSVPYPYASSLAQEIFQSGIVPGETDFRIFRDFGKVSGLDFAWSTNGYVYHTRFDKVDQIPLGSLQRSGDNILALVRGIISGHYLSDSGSQYPDGSLVFFDFLGAFVIRWPQYMASAVNLTGIFLGIYSIYLNMQSARRDIKTQTYMKQLMSCVVIVIVSWIISMSSVTLIALILTKLGRVMSWYARPAWLFFLYVCPTVFVSMIFFMYIASHQKRVVTSAWTLYQLYCDAYSVIWMIILFICVLLKIRSGFIPLHWVLFSAVGNILRQNFFNYLKDWKWLCYQLGTLTLPYVQSFYLAIGALYLFTPIMGRAGAGINSEVVMANMLAILFCLLLSFTLPIVLLIKNADRVMSVLIGTFLFATGILILTPLGFPYSGDPLAPAPERFMIAHAQRQFYQANGTLRHSTTGFWVVDLDMNSPQSVEAMVPEMGAAIPTIKDCENELYCGLPYLMPVTTFLWKTSWIPGPAPLIKIPTELNLISKISKGTTVNLTFNVTGPDHIGIIMSPYEGVHLQKWSILEGQPLQGPKWKNRETYFVYYSCASNCEPYSFSLELITPSGHRGPCLSIALAGHFLHGENQKSLRFKRFLSQFPSWTIVTPWTASYTLWEF